jgi:hypothetical protein
MSWSARIAHTSAGLAIVFAGPVTRLDFTPDVAAHFASLLAAEARSAASGVDHENGGFRAQVRARSGVSMITRLHPLCCTCDPCLNGDQQ